MSKRVRTSNKNAAALKKAVDTDEFAKRNARANAILGEKSRADLIAEAERKGVTFSKRGTKEEILREIHEHNLYSDPCGVLKQVTHGAQKPSPLPRPRPQPRPDRCEVCFYCEVKQCHRSPPVRNQDYFQNRWVTVRMDDWCGEFKRR